MDPMKDQPAPQQDPGQRPDPWGEPAPSYGESAASYGEPAPTYGEPAAPPGEAAPAHGAQPAPVGEAPAAAQQTPSYSARTPTYGWDAPPPAGQGTGPAPAQSTPAFAAGHASPAPGPAPQSYGATAPRRRGPGWGGVSALVLLGMMLSSGVTLGGVVAYDQLLAPEPAVTQEAPARSTEASPASSPAAAADWATIAEQVSPSAVSITVATGSGTSQGTGVILDAQGTILTNDHVVSDGQEIAVTTSDGLSYRASLVGSDPTTDLAVIRLDSPPEGLQPATFADSTTVEVGQPVMALGTPLGLENTVTTGIVSAIDRPVAASGDEEDGSDATYTSAIQTDAAINPGNSGGPLVDAAGQVVGINTAIAGIPGSAGQAGSIGLGFAIPSSTAIMIAEQLQEDGTAEHAFLGVTTSDGSADDDEATYRGAEVVAVEPDSPAAEAGLQKDDLIIGVDDIPVGGAAALTGVVRGLEIDSTHSLRMVREGSVETVEVTLGVRGG